MHRGPAGHPVRLRCFFLSCRIFAAVSSPCCFPHPAVFSILHVRISPSLPSRFPIYRAIPTFRRCAVSLHFLLTFRRCAEAALPREPPVSAFPHPSCHSHLPKLLTFRRCAEAALPRKPPVASFPHPPYHSHLPKVCSFPTFSTHLPKVCRSTTASRAVCSRISPSTVPFPPSEGEQVPHNFYSPSEGVQKHYRLESRL